MYPLPTDLKPPTNSATVSSGLTVAERAMRWNSPLKSTSLSTAVMRWVPRLLPATAWISSRMTVVTPVSVARLPLAVSRMFRLSGVVMRISGGWRSILRRSSPGVSPLRVWTLRAGKAAPARAKYSRSSCSGAIRLRRTSLLSALRGET